MIKFSISIFLHFRTQQVFPGYLAKFQSITKHGGYVLLTFISENLAAPLFSLFDFLVENWSKRRHILKNTTRIKIVITTTVDSCTNTGVKVFVLLRASCCTNFYYNFNPCGIFENMIGTRKINGRPKSSKITVQKNVRCNVCNKLKFGKISRKDLLCTKCKKMDIENLITLKPIKRASQYSNLPISCTTI